MPTPWTLQRQIRAVFILTFVVFALSMTISMRNLHRFNLEAGRSAEALASTMRMGVLTMQLSAVADMLVVAAYEHNGPAIEAEWKTAEAAYRELTPVSQALIDATSVEANRDRARKILDAMKQWHSVVGKAVEDARAGRAEEASAAMRMSEQYSDDIAQTLATEVLTSEQEQSVRSGAAAVRTGWITILLSVIGIVGVVVLVAYVLERINRSLREVASELRLGSEQVVSAAAQVSASAQSLSKGATEQAASLEETSASMEEMASMTLNNAKNAQEAARLMATVDRGVGASNEALTDMTQSMATIRESSDRVSKIIKTIDEIAFQTNILALNAAVEAARAGEAGLGFAVVADEVRNLAQRSAQAARDTAALIEESIANSQAGNSKVELVAQSIAAIIETVTQVKGLVNEVSEASRQQSQGVAQVAQAVAQMEKVTQATAANAEESAAASEELNAQAEGAMGEVERLDRMVTGTRVAVVGHLPTRVQRTPAPVRRTRTGAAGAALSKRINVPVERRSPLSPGAALRGTATQAEHGFPQPETGTEGRF